MVKVVHIVGLFGALALVVAAGTSLAAPKPLSASASLPGNDISYPQCGHTLPTAHSFGIVGVNGGTAGSVNPCLHRELRWAATSTGAGPQPKVSLYVNTGNPGDVAPTVPSWPKTSDPIIDPYGSCSGKDTAACAWQYGYQSAYADAARASSPRWWLDVESVNSWSRVQANNRADLEGMAYAFTIAGSRVGIYSFPPEWAELIGPVPPNSRLSALAEWLPGAETEAQGKSNCDHPPLTPAGTVTLTQYTHNQVDYDVSCP